MSDGCVEQHAVRPKLKRGCDVAGRANTRIHNDRVTRVIPFEILENDLQIVGVQDPLAGTDWGASRHNARRSRSLESNCHDWIVAGVTENLKSLVDQPLACLQRGDRIG